MAERMPWHAPEFCDWVIRRMRHYDRHDDRQRFLYVEMENSDGKRIMEGGPDDERLWERLKFSVEAVELEADTREGE